MNTGSESLVSCTRHMDRWGEFNQVLCRVVTVPKRRKKFQIPPYNVMYKICNGNQKHLKHSSLYVPS